MKQQKKFSNHAMPARRPRKTQGKCVLFADAAKLYIEYSKAVTSAETAVKRMRFFAQFYNAAFAELVFTPPLKWLTSCVILPALP